MVVDSIRFGKRVVKFENNVLLLSSKVGSKVSISGIVRASSAPISCTTLKTAHVAMSDVVIKNIANRIDLTEEIICPGPLLPGCDVSDIS